jgi:glycosyltransferase involved in cell wall biosynthesis
VKILFDGRVYQFQKAGGINRYFAELIAGLPPEWVPVIAGATDFGRNVPKHPNLSVLNPPRLRPRRYQPQFNRLLWGPRVVRDVKLLHPTYYDLTSDFQLSDFKCPVVTTVHDMIYARFPAQTEGAEFIVKAQREAVVRANRVVCVSQSTQTDLMELIPEAAGKTVVIHHGCSFPVVEESPGSRLYESPTFLFVGYRGGYKNFLFALRAFAKAASAVNNIQLRVVGPEFTTEERWQMHFLGLTNKVAAVTYPDEVALQEIYRNSVALLYPSRYEGFGIPPLEAMACGTVAVTANTTSLPEVVGDGGIMLDPADEDAWADCIIRLAQPFPERTGLLERARRQAKRFLWTESVRRHLDIYREMTN